MRGWRGRVLAAVLVVMPGTALGERLASGTFFLSDALKARQADSAANPGMLWVEEGAGLWRAPAGATGKSCADCHGASAEKMRGVAVRYPMVEITSGQLLNLEARINRCRTVHQQADALAYETDRLLALTAFVARRSNGMAMNVATAGPAAKFMARGKAFFEQRQGQLDLACKDCHVDNVGRRLRGDTISHGIAVGYPAYRLEWQTMGSLHRRLRSCSYAVRAVRFPAGSQTYLELELYLAMRARGVELDGPAIRP
ncbi:MAG: sulfur oxidation c-type cytochrome SoxA [Hyphomicrobiaceae bacterium]|nr:sulfur oxidation c-type cytochrome SoxA [Hyphomicrobiaceae bacterium]